MAFHPRPIKLENQPSTYNHPDEGDQLMGDTLDIGEKSTYQSSSTLSCVVKIGPLEVTAVVDPDTLVTVINSCVCDTLMLNLTPIKRRFINLGGNIFTVDWETKLKVLIDGTHFDMHCLVVSVNYIDPDLIIGSDFLDSTSYTIRDRKVHIKRRRPGFDTKFSHKHSIDKKRPFVNTPPAPSFDFNIKIKTEPGTECGPQTKRIKVDVKPQIKREPQPPEPTTLFNIDIDQLLHDLSYGRNFTTLTLENGFLHEEVETLIRDFTSTVAPDAECEVLKTPFGICVAPATLQRYADHVFKDLIKAKIAVVNGDDLYVLAENEWDGTEKLDAVFQTAARHGLKYKWKSSQFLQPKVSLGGFDVSGGELSPSEEKIAAVLNIPMPERIEDVKMYLRAMAPHSKFIRDYAWITRPMTEVIKSKKNFQLYQRHVESYRIMRWIFASKPVLRFFEQGLNTEIHTSVSREAYGATLMQVCPGDCRLHPVDNMSRLTTIAESNYLIVDLEVLAIVEAVKAFRQHLTGVPFKIVTDYNAFQNIMKERHIDGRAARWAATLEEFNYSVEQRPDPLSTYTCSQSIKEEEHCLESRVKAAQKRDDFITLLATTLERHPQESLPVRGGILYKRSGDVELPVVPSELQSEVAKKAHGQDHLDTEKTIDAIGQKYWFPNAKQKVQQVIENCVLCTLIHLKDSRPAVVVPKPVVVKTEPEDT